MKEEVIYDNHEAEWEECLNNEEKKKISETWMEVGTLDRWRHERMLIKILPFIKDGNEWLTIGDGRYGTDANFIIKNGGKAHATDISDKLLKIGHEKGFIRDFSQQNAENLNFEDNSFDYLLIKESFHHFPRPWLALHEAFRVCKKGVILIEPNDESSLFLDIIKKIMGKSVYNFEPVGNFVYKLNNNELEKFALGMHYRYVGFVKINTSYEKGVEFIKLSTKNRKEKAVINKIRNKIKIRNFLAKIKLLPYSLTISVVFKTKPSLYLKNKLINEGFSIKELPSNPYLNKS